MRCVYFGQSLLAIATFSILFVPPGFVAGYLTNVAGFRRQSPSERLLWSISLSYPLATVIAAAGGVYVGTPALAAILGVLAIISLLLAASLVKRDGLRRYTRPSREAKIIASSLAALVVYIILISVPIIIGTSLYEGTSNMDWRIRVPQLGAAIRSGVPPINPFDSVGGVAAFRYYYYWFDVCGLAGKLSHLPARPVMIGGCVWSALVLFSTLFLALKYLFLPSQDAGRLRIRKLCLWCFGLSFVLGLDFLLAVVLLVKYHYAYPEIEWWRGPTGFSPSFHTAFTYSPHIAAGTASAFIAFLLLVLPVVRSQQFANAARFGNRYILACIAGAGFAATLGGSTFIALFFAIACAFLLCERLYARDFATVRAVLLAGAVTLVLAAPFLHLVASHPLQTLTGKPPFPITIRLRGLSYARSLLRILPEQLAMPPLSRALRFFLLGPLYLLLELSEPGVFLFVVIHRCRRDLRHPTLLLPHQRFQWILFFAFFLSAVALNSEPIQGVNDLGYHAAICLRFVSVLWAAPWFAGIMQERERRARVFSTLWGKLAIVFLMVGICTQIWQLAMQRGFLPLLEHGRITTFPGLYPSLSKTSARAYDAFQAATAMDALLSKDAYILTNPGEVPNGPDLYYSDHQLIAADPLCYTVYGGDLHRCVAVVPTLMAIYAVPDKSHPLPYDASRELSPAAFDATCSSVGADAVLVTSEDPVWLQPQSWVWKMSPIYANRSRRVFRCSSKRSPSSVRANQDQ